MKHSRLRNAALAGVLILGWGTSVSADPGSRPFTGLHVFGDSLSDSAGNLYALTNNVEPPSPPYADGRFSNGPLWDEVLAGMLDLPIGASNNRAVGGAFTDTRNSNAFAFPAAADTGILSQIAQFQDDGVNIRPNDLVIVWGGGINYIFDPFSDPVTVVRDLKQAVEELANLGGRRFLVPNLPALGNVPLGNPLFGILSPEAKAFLNFQSAQHNAELAAVMTELRQDLRIEIVVVDIHATFAGLLAEPEAFGFVNTDVPCLIQLGDGTRIVTGACPPDGMGSFDATGTAFWDLIHPTTALHAIVAMVARSALGALEPMSLTELGE